MVSNIKFTKPFEQFVLDYYLTPKIEYLSQEQLQRFLKPKMIQDLEEITNQLLNGVQVDLKPYKAFYKKYNCPVHNLQLWFLWVQLKNKMIKRKPIPKILNFYEQNIAPKLQNNYIKIKFQIFHCYMQFLAQLDETAVFSFIQIRTQLQLFFDMKKFVSELQLLKTTVIPDYSNILKKFFSQTKEDFFELMYFQIKMLVPISKKVAPSLAEPIFNEIQIILLLSKQIYQQPVEKIQKRYEYLENMMNKYYQQYGRNLFTRKEFSIQPKLQKNKVSKSMFLLNKLEQQNNNNEIVSSLHKFSEHVLSFHKSNNLSIINSEFPPQKTNNYIQPFHSHAPSIDTRATSAAFKISSHSRNASTRGPSQFNPEQVISKELWLEIDNYKTRKQQKLKQVEKQTASQIYRKLISSVPETRRHSHKHSESDVIGEVPEEVYLKTVEELEKQKLDLDMEDYYKKISKPRIKFITVMIALNMKYFHEQLPGSKAFAKLVARNFLDILTYIDDPPYKEPEKVDVSVALQSKTVTKRITLNRGNSRRFKAAQPKLGMKQLFVGKQVNFSEKVRHYINKIKFAIRMGIFKKRGLKKQGTIFGALAPKHNAIRSFLDVNRRLKTLPDINTQFQEKKPVQSVPTPKHRLNSSNDLPQKTSGITFGFFKAISIAKKLSLQLVHPDEIKYLKEKYGDLAQKNTQHYYFPSIKYSLFMDGVKQFWKIKYRDKTKDKNFMVIHVSQEGKTNNFFRFDIPCEVALTNQPGITIWPNVCEALKGLDQTLNYSKIFDFNLTIQSRPNMRSFLVGLTQRARLRIQNNDIEAAAFVQSYFSQIQKTQIIKIKKQRGYVFEILPIIKGSKFIDLPRINQIIIYINRINHQNEKQKYLKLYRKDIDYQEELNEAIQKNQTILSATLMLRFLCSNKQFHIDGKQEHNLKGHSMCIHSQLAYAEDTPCKYALMTLELVINKDVNFNLGPILVQPLKASVKQIYGQEIDKSIFSFQISTRLFKIDTNKIKDHYLQPFMITIQLYEKLLGLLNYPSKLIDSLKFNSIIDIILFQRELSLEQKGILSEFMQKYFVIKSKLQLNNGFDYLGGKQLSINFLKKDFDRTMMYAISPLEKLLKKKVVQNVSAKDQQKDQLFKLEYTEIQYEDVYQGKQTVEEPDFMSNTQDLQMALNQVKQIPICTDKILKKFLQTKLKLNILTLQSYYVNCQLPSSIKFKTMILNNDPELVNYLNCNRYSKLFSRDIKVDIYCYYSFDRRLDINNDKGNERIYYFDGNMLFFNLHITNTTTKTQSIKMIFTQYDLQELFQIKFDYIQPLFYFYDMTIIEAVHKILQNTYSEKKFLYNMPTFLHNQYQQQNSRQTFINYKKSVSILSDNLTVNTPKGNTIQFNNLRLLERHSNCKFGALFDDVKDSYKNYCETELKETRVIGHFIKKLYLGDQRKQFEYAVITVYCHLIIDVWIIQIYFPKTSRYLLGSINILDLASLDLQNVFELLNEFKLDNIKKSGFKRRPTMNIFIGYKQKTFINLTKFFDFTREQSNTQNKKLINQRLFMKQESKESKIEYAIWKKIIEHMKLSIKEPYNIRVESENQNKSYIEKTLIEQIEQDTNANQRSFKIIGESVVQRKKNESVENQEMLSHFKTLSNMYQTFIKQHQIVMIKSQFNESSKLCINLNFIANLKEFIHQMQMRVEKIGLYSITFFLENLSEDDQIDNPFLSFDSINYANSSNYNLSIRIFAYSMDQPVFYCNKQVNLREILNLFIADGYFKYQTNYMNAKLSLADLKQICEYVGFKIKTQNFLGLANQQKYINTHPIFLEEQKADFYELDGFIHTEYKGGTLYQLQLFIKNQKVHVNKTKNCMFEQTKLYFHQIDEICPYFTQIIEAGRYYQGLRRLMMLF